MSVVSACRSAAGRYRTCRSKAVQCIAYRYFITTHKGISCEALNQQTEQIMNEYGNHILRLAYYSYLHNMSDAEEVLQDTLIQFLKTAPSFEYEEHQKAWLLCVACNLSKDRIDYNQVRHSDELKEELASILRENESTVRSHLNRGRVKLKDILKEAYDFE